MNNTPSLLVVFTLLLAVLGLAQAQDRTDALLPPRLFLVVLLDNSGTMVGDTSSQVARMSAPNQRRGSDPNRARHAALERILEQLNMDTQEHRAAVLSFAQGQNQLRWLTRDETVPNGVAIPLGSSADRAPYQRFLADLRALPNGTGPGDIGLALSRAQAEVGRYGAELSNYKLVALLIADDVPIVQFAESPWQGSSSTWRPVREAFELALTSPEWVNRARYNGLCQHDGGQPLFSVIALGNANWIDSTGRLIPSNQVSQALGAGNTYYQALLTAQGAQRRDGSGPLVYAVDPLLNRTDLDAVLLRAVQDWLSEVLCLWNDHNQFGSFEGEATLSASSTLIAIEGEPNINNTTIYNLPMSLLYAQVRLVVEGQASVRVLMADGQPLPISPVELSYNASSVARQTRLWLLKRDDPRITAQAWDGVWRIVAEGPNNASTAVHFMRHLIPDELRWSLASSVLEAYDPTQGHNFDVRLTIDKAGTPVAVRPNDLIAEVVGVLCPSNPANPIRQITYQATETLYQGSSRREETQDGETYRFYVRYRLARPVVGSTADEVDCSSNAERRYGPTLSLPFRSSEQLNIESPPNNAPWTCPDDGRQPIKARLSLSGRSDERADNLNLYAAVQVFYPPPTLQANPSPTPALLLQWQGGADGLFEGYFDCQTLQAGSGSMLVRAVFPNNRDKTETRGFTFSPTATPTPTPTPEATAAPTLFPTPLPPSIEGDLKPILDADFIPAVLIAVGSLAGLGGLVRLFQRYQWLRQQRIVIIEDPHERRHLLIRGLWRVLPLRTRFSFKDSVHGPLFGLDVRPQRLTLILEKAGQVNGQLLQARTPHLLSSRETEINLEGLGRYLVIYDAWRRSL
ncbi:MAG: VWA domain-containing protein [Anaerolineae bacterium]|nr:VWA domain-containing protein [Anaerolineae bacterium]MDW8173740.1 VWA domain-containing protein [Anaerolineae bacterium]